jgi:hypothetical protein
MNSQQAVASQHNQQQSAHQTKNLSMNVIPSNYNSQ